MLWVQYTLDAMKTNSLLPFLVLATAPLFVGCRAGDGAAPSSLEDRLLEAHGGPGWYSTPGIETRITIELGGVRALEGTMLFEPATGRCRIALADGAVMVFDGQEAWAPEGVPRSRFHTLTWPYFMGIPWKLRDTGAQVAQELDRPLGGKDLPTARLTFSSGTGDTPDDWYVLFEGRDSHRLEAVAYIVTYGKSAEEAEETPSLGVYSDYHEVQDLLLPGRMDLYYWDQAVGAGAVKGWATFEEIRVVTPPAGSFERPEGSVADKLPG